MNEKLRKAITKEKSNKLKNGVSYDFYGMINKPFLICLFGFFLKDLKLNLKALTLVRIK